jgi:hypothetical protein
VVKLRMMRLAEQVLSVEKILIFKNVGSKFRERYISRW